jgi:hypothetical protein
MSPDTGRSLRQRIATEITQLSEEQTEAMCRATFLGMTLDEAKQYEERRRRIADLIEQLEMVAGRRAL